MLANHNPLSLFGELNVSVHLISFYCFIKAALICEMILVNCMIHCHYLWPLKYLYMGVSFLLNSPLLRLQVAQGVGTQLWEPEISCQYL